MAAINAFPHCKIYLQTFTKRVVTWHAIVSNLSPSISICSAVAQTLLVFCSTLLCSVRTEGPTTTRGSACLGTRCILHFFSRIRQKLFCHAQCFPYVIITSKLYCRHTDHLMKFIFQVVTVVCFKFEQIALLVTILFSKRRVSIFIQNHTYTKCRCIFYG